MTFGGPSETTCIQIETASRSTRPQEVICQLIKMIFVFQLKVKNVQMQMVNKIHFITGQKELLK